MNTNAMTLTITDDGFVGISGGKKFENAGEVETIIDEISRKLLIGLETRERMTGAEQR